MGKLAQARTQLNHYIHWDSLGYYSGFYANPLPWYASCVKLGLGRRATHHCHTHRPLWASVQTHLKSTTMSANFMLREIGISAFLASVAWAQMGPLEFHRSSRRTYLATV